MGRSAIADKEAMLAALAQIEVLTAQMNRLSINGFTPVELLELQKRREAVTRAQPVLGADHLTHLRWFHRVPDPRERRGATGPARL